MDNVFAIDPGNRESAYIVYRPEDMEIGDCGIIDNYGLLDYIYSESLANCTPVIEMVASYGMAVGATVFETCVWIGRFTEAMKVGQTMQMLYRKDVKMHLCQSMRARDSNIRQAIIDKYVAAGKAYGGGNQPHKGTKKQPGPLYQVRQDIWAALAVAITWAETRCKSAR